jgi:3,4-dihydroxy 2-butanone 4-phosphate synthase/GTP cyclohydrolase II
VYLRDHEGCGIGLTHEPLTVGRSPIGEQSELGLPAGSRQHGIASQILDDLGITTVRLVTKNSPGWARVPSGENIRYLSTKREPAPKRLDAIGGVDSLAQSVSPEASSVEGRG